ncbi:MAG: hypothetical protein SFX73_24535 [Kofleriaceae bacterium]|nr:hypothetical protein [Kofleriaceae bacterium]
MRAHCLSPLAILAALSCPTQAEPTALTVLVRAIDGRVAVEASGVIIARETTARIQIDVGGPASSAPLEVSVTGVRSTLRRIGPRTFVVTLVTDDITPAHGTLHIGSAVRDIVVQGVPAVRLPHRPWEAGVFGGYRETSYGRPASLGEPARGASLSAGATSGLRAAWSSRRVGVELELGIDRLVNARGDASSTLLSYRAFVVVRHDDGPATVRLAAGLGAQSILDPSTGLERDTKLAVTWGVTGGYRHGPLIVRGDLRLEMMPGDDGLAHGASLLLGASLAR